MKPLALKWRISIAGTAALIAIISTIAAVAYHELEESLADHLRRYLRDTAVSAANEFVSELELSRGLDAAKHGVRTIMPKSRGDDFICYRVWLDGDRKDLMFQDLSSGSDGRWLRELPAKRQPDPGSTGFLKMNRRGVKFQAVWARKSFSGGTVNVLVAQSTEELRHEMDEFLKVLLILGGCTAVGSMVIGSLIVIWSLRPIGLTADRIRQLTDRNLDTENLDDIEVPNELEGFREATVDLLGRLNDVMVKQKQFTADASHELRTPLSLAKSTLQLARSRDRGANEYKQAIEETLDDIDKMEKIIKQLLILARTDESRVIAQMEELRLDLLIAELVERLNAETSSSEDHRIRSELIECNVCGNEELLVELFRNLLENALKYGPPRGVVTVTLSRDSDNICHVRFHDEGGNIEAKDLERIFDRFYRVDSSHNRATGGSGLGLAIARNIVKLHGGDISVTSDLSEGTSFIVTIPETGSG